MQSPCDLMIKTRQKKDFDIELGMSEVISKAMKSGEPRSSEFNTNQALGLTFSPGYALLQFENVEILCSPAYED